MITAETITTQRILELHREGRIRSITAAHAIGISYPTSVDRKPDEERRRDCRSFCAAVANEVDSREMTIAASKDGAK